MVNFRRSLISSSLLIAMGLCAPIEAKTFVHPHWQFRVELPDEWRVLSHGGVLREPVVISTGVDPDESLRIFRLDNHIGRLEAANGDERSDSAAETAAEASARDLRNQLHQRLGGLNGIQSSIIESIEGVEGAPAAIDMLAGVVTDDGFRHLLIRSIPHRQETLVLVGTLSRARLDSEGPAFRSVFDSFERLETDNASADRFWLGILGLILLSGVGIVVGTRGCMRMPRPLSRRFAPLTWCVAAMLGIAFLLTFDSLRTERAEQDALLTEIERLENEFPGVSRIDFPDALIRQDYREAVDRFRSWPSTGGAMGLGLRTNRPSLRSLVTYSLIHSGWSHLLWNLLFIVLCGGVVERVGGKPVLLSSLVLGSAAAATGHWWWHHRPDLLIGASGGASALVGAALVLGFWAPIGPSLQTPGRRIELSFPLGLVLVAWIANQLWQARAGEDAAALALHASGLGFGLALALSARALSRSPSGINEAQSIGAR